MNHAKSILLSATALALFAAPQVAQAQSVATGATFLTPPATPSTNLDIFPDSQIVVRGMTADGSTVLANYALPSNSPNQASVNRNTNNIWVWTNGVPRTIVISRPTPPNGETALNFSADSISGDGLTITGNLFGQKVTGSTTVNLFRPVIWTQATGLTYLPDLSATEIARQFVYTNTNGTQFAVSSRAIPYLPDGSRNPLGVSTPHKAYRYSPTTGYQSLGSLGATITMDVGGISGSGNVIFGSAYDLSAANIDVNGDPISFGGFRWDSVAGLSRLPDLSAAPLGGTLATYSVAIGISRDGSTIVGQSRGSDGRFQATYWRSDGIHALGYLPGLASPTTTDIAAIGVTAASRASADGSIIVGGAIDSSGGLAWRWTATEGMQNLNLLASNAGLNLNGFVLNNAVGISDSGQFITGTASKGPLDSFGSPAEQQGYVLSIAAAPITPTTLTTSARLIVTLTLPGVTQTSIVNQTFSTQVDAKLNGATVFTRTVGDQITGSLGVTALADARTSLQQTSGLRRVVIGAPVLVTNTTSVLSSTSNTVNVASGTQVTTAAVVTNGPATVATGDLGTCATVASDGVNPTGCSLPGTAVTVNANVVNTNTFTNTINSITPTTTTTVNQLVSAKWQVSATAGNQFGTVHALTGVAAFDRGDRLIGQLLGMGGGQSSGSDNHVARAAMPMRDANGLVGEDSGLTMFGGYFGNWSHIDADASVPVADVKGSTNGFVLGLEKRLGAARLGVAVDHGTSDYTVRDATYPETLSFEQTQVALFAGWQGGGFSLDGAAAYGFGTARTTLTTPTTPATANRDVKSWSLGAQAGYTVALGKRASVELVGGVRHVSANLNAFTETGGPSPLLGRDQTVHRTRAYAGIEARAGIDMGGVTLTPRLHARYAHDSGSASGTADLVFVSAPNGPVMQAVGPGVGRDVAELGGSLDAAVGGNVHLWLGYDGTFRKGARSHAAKAGVTVAW